MNFTRVYVRMIPLHLPLQGALPRLTHQKYHGNIDGKEQLYPQYQFCLYSSLLERFMTKGLTAGSVKG